MIRQSITLGNHSFLVDMYKDKIDLTDTDRIKEEYVMIRSYEFRNSVIYDTAMYFIEKSIWNEYVNRLYHGDELLLKKDLTSGLIFPISSMLKESFSLDIDQFNYDMNDSYFTDNNSSPLVYDLYRKSDISDALKIETDDDLMPTNIYCDKLRIYHPHTTNMDKFIVHCDTYINNLHIHILARDLSWYYRKSNKEKYVNSVPEFQDCHNYYSEYVDVIIPDLDDLFSGDIFFRENMNYGDLAYIDKKYESLVQKYSSTIINNDSFKHTYQSLFVYNIPFTIEKLSDVDDLLEGYFLITNKGEYLIDGNKNFLVWKESDKDLKSVFLTDRQNNYLVDEQGHFLVYQGDDENGSGIYGVDPNFTAYDNYIKHYIPEYLHTTAQSQMNYPITVSFVPYNSNYIYETGKNAKRYPELTDRIVLGFGEHNMLVASDEYELNKDQFYIESKIKLKSHIGFDNEGYISLINEFDYPERNTNKFQTFSDVYEYYNGIRLDDYLNIIDDEDEDGWYDEESESSMQCGVIFEIFTDKYKKDKVYNESFGFKSENVDGKEKLIIDDFSFHLNSLFINWSQYPGILYIRCKFVDKYLGKTIFGNVCTLTKEQFKYLINDTYHPNKILLTNSDKSSSNKKIYKKSDVMDISKFNFLNNIQINVNNSSSSVSENNNGTTISDVSHNNMLNTKTKIIYKPIFYKVHDLQSIVLRRDLTQNIGVNLIDFMTKVETFKMVINGKTIVEYARNNNYVIFNITTNQIIDNGSTDTVSGEYHILNQDDEYLSSGNWFVQ